MLWFGCVGALGCDDPSAPTTRALAARPAAAEPSPAQREAASPPAQSLGGALTDSAHAVLNEHCGACHDGARPTALPPSLAIFDLSVADWSATVLPQDIPGIIRRVEEQATPEQLTTVRRWLEEHFGAQGISVAVP